MSARFAELMAMSAAQTRDSVAATQQILEEKKRKEEQRKKEQLERERKEREIQARQVKKRLEEEKLAEERKRKQEEERRRKEELLEQREEEKRRHMVYGNDRKSSGSSGGGGRGRKSQNDSDHEDEVGGLALTREEKRKRRLLADLNKSFTSARKGHSSPASQGFKKPNRAFANLDLADSSPSRSADHRNGPSNAADSMLAVRKQLASSSATLMKLGTAKRDLRTIDEIVTDIHKKKEGKVIEGEVARKNGFDWFGEQKQLKSKTASLPSLSPSPDLRASLSPRTRSKERALPSKPSSSALPRPTASSQIPERKEPRAKVTMIKPEPASLSSSKAGRATSASTKSLASSKSAGALRSAASNEKSTASSSKKRSWSESLSDSDVSKDDYPPMSSKRRPVASSAKNDISSEIWKLFGKDRSRYMQNDVFSDDDDDMEADADALRREELRSEKIAKKEDDLALEEERRHEEEKRRRKKEKERRGF